MKSKLSATLLVFISVTFIFITIFPVVDVYAGESEFRKTFLEHKRSNNFPALRQIIKQNKKIIPGEVEQLIKESRRLGVNEQEKNRLVDLAYQIAKMHQDWNGGYEEKLARLETLIAKIREKKKAERLARAEAGKANRLSEPDLSPFINEYLEYKYSNNFSGLKITIKRNKAKIPGEIDTLLKQARTEGITRQESVRIFDLAYQIAKMHQEWNDGSQKTVDELEVVMDEIRRGKKQERESKARVARVELIPGNFVMNTAKEELKSAGVKPVVFPHWVHRSFYRCKVCHEGIINMKRGANDLTHENLDAGKVCGACHNGETSFATNEKGNCRRCHNFDTPEAEPLIDLSYYNKEKFTETAGRLGAGWNAKKLTEGKLPKGKLGFIDFARLESLGAFEPISSINAGTTGADTEGTTGAGGADEGVRDSLILFTLPKKFSFMLKDVVFSHKVHTSWVNCSICHQKTEQREKIFEKKAGATRVNMVQIKEGKSCGTCHGRVSFPVSDCKRCHAHSDDPKSGTIVRKTVTETPVPDAPAPKPEKQKQKKPKPGSGRLKSTY